MVMFYIRRKNSVKNHDLLSPEQIFEISEMITNSLLSITNYIAWNARRASTRALILRPIWAIICDLNAEFRSFVTLFLQRLMKDVMTPTDLWTPVNLFIQVLYNRLFHQSCEIEKLRKTIINMAGAQRTRPWLVTDRSSNTRWLKCFA